VRVPAAPLLDASGEPRGAVAAALDITQLKDYEAELEHAVRRRDEFLAVLAHELRNPLTPVQHSVQILHRAPDDVHRVRKATVTIDRQVALMDRLIADLLDVARISQGIVELDPEPRALEALVDGALDAVRPVAERSGHRFEVRHEVAGACAWVDAFRAEQVVVNLLSNAIKYSPRGSRVRVTTGVADAMCRIEVADEGHGILPEHQREIFTMFARPGVGARPRTAGMGVGLALAKQLAEQHGGHIDVRSDGRERGSTFVAWFPVAVDDASDAS
jgi:signal transduction histidine kinase